MKQRSEIIRNIAGAACDLCVIGAGASGSGCALDAQLRGLKVLLLDAGDFGGATSTASTKLIHGGLRYLQQAVMELVRKYNSRSTPTIVVGEKVMIGFDPERLDQMLAE